MVERKNFLLTKFKFLTERQKGREKPFSPQFNEENLKSDLEEATKKLQAKVLVQGEPVEIITIVSGEKYQRDDRGLSLKCLIHKKNKEDKTILLNLVTYNEYNNGPSERQFLEMISLVEGTKKGYRFAIDLNDYHQIYNETIGITVVENYGKIEQIRETNIGRGKPIPNEHPYSTFINTARLVLKSR